MRVPNDTHNIECGHLELKNISNRLFYIQEKLNLILIFDKMNTIHLISGSGL